MIEELGINEVKERLINDDYLKPYIKGIFPVINVDGKDADAIRFSINFFTAIGLGVLTEEMRYVLDNLSSQKKRMTVDEVDQEAIQEVLRVVVTIHGQEVILVVNQDHQEVQIREVDKDLKLKNIIIMNQEHLHEKT